MNTILDKLIARVGELPPIPMVTQKALDVIRDPDSSMGELANILSMDEAMTSLVLRWVNSAYYGLKYPVSTVQQAVTFLGQRTLHSLVLAASVASLLDRAAPGYALERGELWRHSIGVAAGARLIAAKFGQRTAEEAYHAGLLCDIGKLAFEVLLRDVDMNSEEWQYGDFKEMETIHFGVDHATLGAEMARRWRLPAILVDAIAHHHNPSEAAEAGILAAAVHVADAAVMSLGIGIGKDGLQYVVDEAACERVGWNESMFSDLSARIVPFVEEADKYIRARRK
ncbi:MAG: HDOD domain-containing protein [Chloroflexi bacterium]|nr:HDOD domain-containing protein [Chloroflexota bacterium]